MFLTRLSARASKLKRMMSTFVSVINPSTGKADWKLQNENYDYHQEIARSGYADMLHDTERNKKYYMALEKAIKIKRDLGQPVHVLDIGTGTGLLSMMAARLGADTITACEAFEPMAKCAVKIIKKNRLHNKIHVIQKRSTEITVGQGCDMEHRANILVTEVFDTELIGEGAVGTFNHAHRELLEKDCIVVPTAANMYVQVVSSDFVRQWRDIEPVSIPGCEDVSVPSSMTLCGGAPALHDLQLHQLSQHLFQILSKPIHVFRFDFSGKVPLNIEDHSKTDFDAEASGRTDGILMWWDLEMDTKKQIILSCAPGWAHPSPQELQWRDHWMQAIYYPNKPVSVQKGDKVMIGSHHDEYSLWFSVQTNKSDMKHEGPSCTCGMHILYSRSQIGMLNDPNRRGIYLKMLTNKINSESVCMVISNGSLLSLMAVRLGAKKVFILESNNFSGRITQEFVNRNNLQGKVSILTKEPEDVSADDLDGLKVDFVLGDPFFQSSVLPWHHIYFWYAACHMTHHFTNNVEVLPRQLIVKAVAVEFEDLWKIRAPVGICEGFDIHQFDDLIEQSSEIADSVVEPQPLWEYPCTACSEAVIINKFDFTDLSWQQKSVQTANIKLNLTKNGNLKCNGVALWAEYDFGVHGTVSTGPRQAISFGNKVEWDYYSRQGVHLFKQPITEQETFNVIEVSLTFKPQNGDFDFKFKLIKS